MGPKGFRTLYTTNDIPGCPNNGGLLLGTDKKDKLAGEDGDDRLRGLGDKDGLQGGDGSDVIYGGTGDDRGLYAGKGDDVIYGGTGDDEVLVGGPGEDVIYGGDGADSIDAIDSYRDGEQRDELYCGNGNDHYVADKIDYVDSSCEAKMHATPFD
jgi:Ca2+-binding RTX toxin-like protein